MNVAVRVGARSGAARPVPKFVRNHVGILSILADGLSTSEDNMHSSRHMVCLHGYPTRVKSIRCRCQCGINVYHDAYLWPNPLASHIGQACLAHPTLTLPLLCGPRTSFTCSPGHTAGNTARPESVSTSLSKSTSNKWAIKGGM